MIGIHLTTVHTERESRMGIRFAPDDLLMVGCYYITDYLLPGIILHNPNPIAQEDRRKLMSTDASRTGLNHY